MGPRGPTLSVDGEHQGPVAGVELQEHGRLDQVLRQVAQEGDRPARQVRTVSPLPLAPRRPHTCTWGRVPECSLPTGYQAMAQTTHSWGRDSAHIPQGSECGDQADRDSRP